MCTVLRDTCYIFMVSWSCFCWSTLRQLQGLKNMGCRCSKCSGVVQILLIIVVRALLRKLPVPLVSLVIPATFPCVSWSCVVTLWPLDIQCRGEGKGHVGQRSFFRAATPSRMILSAWWGQRFKGKIDLSSQGGFDVSRSLGFTLHHRLNSLMAGRSL